MSDKFKFSKFFGLDDEDSSNQVNEPNEHQPKSKINPEQPNPQPSISQLDSKIVSIQQKQNQSSKISIFEPRVYSDAKKISSSLIDNNAAIVNFDHTDNNSITRIIDFLSGTVFTLDGSVERIGDRVFLFTPHKFEISGDDKGDLRDHFR
ncbi:cell division protein SepF [Nicoliella spurrieriana]|uniref:Cell division protein SepF n=1 Tax=Nicoliella spurrieriana TaxID=2925830 RepID=A0A976RRH5_9LACO|nr:cell division protein SepF [Nicoliella spurrieriana]UQS86439.1 cell division protein SepF [Nicoliella spurrieriana]